MAIIKARRIPLNQRHADLTPWPHKPGDFRFEDMDYDPAEPPAPGADGRLCFACPMGHGHCGSIEIGNGFKPGNGRPSWQWDGNAEAPTLTPSINCKSHGPNGEKYAGCGWYGWLTAGEFKD